MTSNDPYQKTEKNRKNLSSQGDREKLFTVIHVDKTAPEAICIDLVSAKNEAAANTVAKRKFPNSTVLRVSLNVEDVEASQYPDARFIKGEFLPVDRAGDTN